MRPKGVTASVSCVLGALSCAAFPAGAEIERSQFLFRMTTDADNDSTLRLRWPPASGPASVTPAPTAPRLSQPPTLGDLDAPADRPAIAPPSFALATMPLTDSLRLGAAGSRRALDPEHEYFALSAEAQLTGMNNAGLWIGYDLYRDWTPESIPETDLPREALFVEFRMSF